MRPRWDDERILLKDCRAAEPQPEQELPETTRQTLTRQPIQPKGKPAGDRPSVTEESENWG